MANPCQGQEGTKEFKYYSKMKDELMHKIITPKGAYPKVAERLAYSQENAEVSVRSVANDILKLPFDSYTYYTENQWKKIDSYYRDYNKRLDGKFARSKVFGNLGYVPEGISKMDPASRTFHLKMNSISGYERNFLGKNSAFQSKLANGVRNSFLDRGIKTGLLGINYLKKVTALQEKAQKSELQSDKLIAQKELERVVASDDGVIIRDFQLLTEMSNIDFIQARRLKKIKIVEKNEDGTDNITYHKVSTLEVNNAKMARDYLSDVSKTAIESLETTSSVVDRKWNLLDGKRSDFEYRNFKEQLDSAIDRIKQGQDVGGYLPRFLLEGVVEVKERFSQFSGKDIVGEGRKELDLLTQTLESINIGAVPGNLKSKNSMLNQVYNQNPLYMIEQYSKEVISFNKMSSMKKVLLDALADIGQAEVNTEFVKGVKRFMFEQHEISTVGLADRPKIFNDITRMVGAINIASTMGLNAPGAASNALSGMYFMSEYGIKNTMITAQNLLKHNTNDVSNAYDIAKKEQGFLYPSVAREIVSEGLVPAEGINTSKWEYDPMTGNVTHQGTPIRDGIAAAQNWGIGKLLFMHQWGEVKQRDWMFRTSFALKYNELMDRPEYMGLMDKNNPNALANQPIKDRARRYATNHAITSVNMFAYEYAIHAKSRGTRGQSFVVDELGNKSIVGERIFGKNHPNLNKVIGGTKGAVQQIASGLMHYPMSLTETYISKYKGVKNEFGAGFDQALADAGLLGKIKNKAGQTGYFLKNMNTNSNVMFFQRHAGLYLAHQLTELLSNSNIGIIDFDLIERLKMIHKNIMNGISDDQTEEKLFGLMSEVTGIGVGKTNYALQKAGLIKPQRSSVEQILFGNVDWDDPKNKGLEIYQQQGTFSGQLQNKYIPTAMKRGAFDNLRHVFKIYPKSKKHDYQLPLFRKTTKIKSASSKRKSNSKKARTRATALRSLSTY